MSAFEHPLRRINIAPVLIGLAAMSIAIEVILQGADLSLWGTSQWRSLAYQNGGFWIGLLHNWRPNYAYQPYLMFATYGFLHGGLAHLVVNMLTLVGLGVPIVARIGSARFLLLYGLSTVGGAAGFALLSNSVQPMVGASGALFGLAGAIAAWEYVDRFTAKMQLWPVLRTIVWLIGLNLILWWAMDGRLAWETHLGGFISGWIVAFIIDPRSRPYGDESDS
jgi:rhomboid protease GluP